MAGIPDPNRDRERAAQVGRRYQEAPATEQSTRGPLADGRGSDRPALPPSDETPDPNRDRERAALGGPLAYLITFRTYGTWLHGDARGSVDRAHNTPGTPLLGPDPHRRRAERARCPHSLVTLDERARRIVHRTILEVCQHRDWSVYELNARSNHVHVVVSAGEPPEQVMRSIKSWTTRRLKEAGLLPSGVKPWARHGSTRYLWKRSQVEAACRYVLDGQGPDT